MSFTFPTWPPTALHLVRLLLAFPKGASHIHVTEVDWEAGTFRFIRR